MNFKASDLLRIDHRAGKIIMFEYRGDINLGDFVLSTGLQVAQTRACIISDSTRISIFACLGLGAQFSDL